MKVLFVVSSLSPGGAERVLALLANRWCTAHDVTVVTIKGRDTDFFHLDSRIHRHALGVERGRWWMPMPYVRIVAALRRLFRSENPDYIVSLVIKTNIFSLIAASCLALRVVVCEHSIIDRDDIDQRQDVLRRILYRKAFRVGVLSESIREEFLRKYPRFNPHSLVVIPNEVHLDLGTVADLPPLEELYGKKRSEIDLVLALGRLIPIKGYHFLIEAFGLVRRRNHRARLAIFGEGPERHSLEMAVDEAGMVDAVRLPGQTRSPASVLAQADVFVMSSRFEGFPMALVEAFCAGVPVVAFDAPGVRDLVIDNQNGLLVPQGDSQALAEAILGILADRPLRARLAAGAREVVDKFSPEKIDRIWFEKVLIPLKETS
jgi:GalNAc-alpha-(1->4)-GalNAc-alpha-(1->3)-diNAcBac-PP-undecaprenol alpha-1,4-N-acetyl-D-galactosaminyltransferase